MGFREFSIKYETNSKALNLGDRSVNYPHYNQAVILAGGAASEKGFILKNVLNLQGKVFDVDALKEKVPKLNNEELDREFGDQYGLYLNHIDMKDPVEVSFLHEFIKRKGFDTKIKEAFFRANINSRYKPNVIFDVTLATVQKAKQIKDWLDFGGYDLVNRHIVWVVNEISVARNQNRERSRQVSEEILLKTHTGVTLTLKELIQQNQRSWFDGDVYIVFNKRDVDTEFKNKVLKKYTAYQLKQAGKPFQPIDQIEEQIIDKLRSYLPEQEKFTKEKMFESADLLDDPIVPKVMPSEKDMHELFSKIKPVEFLEENLNPTIAKIFNKNSDKPVKKNMSATVKMRISSFEDNGYISTYVNKKNELGLSFELEATKDIYEADDEDEAESIFKEMLEDLVDNINAYLKRKPISFLNGYKNVSYGIDFVDQDTYEIWEHLYRETDRILEYPYWMLTGHLIFKQNKI